MTMNKHRSKLSTSERVQATDELEALGKQIAARYKNMQKYEEAAYEKAGFEYDKAKAERAAIENKLLPEARAKCKAAGMSFVDFKKKYCPDMGRTKLYQVLAIADGRTSIEKIREKERAKKRGQRAKDKEEPSVTNKEEPSGTGDVPNSPAAPEKAPSAPAAAPSPQITGSQEEIPIEQRQAEMGDLAEISLTPEERSDDALKAFKGACWDCFPKMLEPDRKKARVFFNEYTNELTKDLAKQKAA
jgi:hypothetical protein